MTPLTFGSLFSGIGGMDLGLEQAGMQCVWQVEIDPFCQKVLHKHWPEVPKHNDVKQVGQHNLKRVNVIAGGFPCQDISIAGLGAGITGARSGLWSEYHRIICELRPDYAIVENVAALLVRGLDRVLWDLASCRYDAEWTVLSARQFGANHLRRRLFIIAYPDSKGGQGLESSRNPRFFGSWRWGSETDLCLPDWRTQPLLDSGPESLLCRKENGVSARVQRLKGIGNAVAPPIAKWIGQRIMEWESTQATTVEREG